MTIDKILENIQQYDCKLIEVTGGEPLLQKECIPLIDKANVFSNTSYIQLQETTPASPK